MKIFYRILILTCTFLIPVCGFALQKSNLTPEQEVDTLNKHAYEARMSDAAKTIRLANEALEKANAANYKPGIAEANRNIGIGYGYQYKQVDALPYYLTALHLFEDLDNKLGQARVLNNIGNLYRDNSYETALQYFHQALNIASKLENKTLLASIYLNIGNINFRQRNWDDALDQFNKSRKMFEASNDTSNTISCIQNIGVTYFEKRDFIRAKEMLLQANNGAKKLDLNTALASIDLTLADLFIAQNDFVSADKYIQEGKGATQNSKISRDYDYTRYELEYKRKDFEKALYYLRGIYNKDSTLYKQKDEKSLTSLKESIENATAYEKAKSSKYLLWGSSVAAGLSMLVIVLLVLNVKRKTVTNVRLTELNLEVSRQKENVDRINQHLEEIIDERTKDLQIKNKKLSEYSSYLSHQIRGPIATLKGLINLEKEGLVDKAECVVMMDKCVSEIDERIITTSEILHDPAKVSF